MVEAVNSVKISSSWRNIAETCEIKLPGLEHYLINVEEQLFKIGDKIKVELSMTPSFVAYKNKEKNKDLVDSDFKTEFEGYIERFQFSTPFTLFCENEAYVWKRKPKIEKHYPQIEITKLLKELFGETVVLTESIPKFTLQKFVINSATPFKVLKELKKNYLLTAYFRGNKLMVGFPYLTELNTPTRRYHLDGDLGNVVRENLTFISKEGLKLKAKVISILKNGKKIELSVGDPEGSERTLHFYNIDDEKELSKMAEMQLEILTQDTLEGSIETFGVPYIMHSDLVSLESKKYPQKRGVFFVDGVNTTFSTSGFRRTVKLGRLMVRKGKIYEKRKDK